MAKIGRENDCKVIFIQHGMYVDFMKREVSLFVRKMIKALRYASYAIRLKKAISLFKVHVFGHSRGLTSDMKELYPHSAFVFSEYWKGWHNDTFFFNNTKSFHFLKNNDIDQDVISLNNTVVYCYQTLIEDGRIDVSYFKKVIHEIIRSVKDSGQDLVVKGHPRMSRSTKEFFKEQGVEVILSGLPSGGVIIGHYSTLLARWVYEGDVLLLVELEDHDIPEPIRNLAISVCQINEFSRVLAQNVKREVNELKELSDYYFNFSGSDSVNSIAEIIRVCDN